MRIGIALIVATVAAMISAATASAHATMNPDQAPAGSFSGFALRIPNEKNVPTVKVSVQLPPGLDEVTFQTKADWTRTQSGRVVSWSGGKIGVGEFDEFGLSMTLPDTPGRTLVFPAAQTYANGQVVHWIGALTADEPAPHITLGPASSASATTTATATSGASNSQDNGRANLALGLAIAALIAGLGALALGMIRRSRA